MFISGLGNVYGNQAEAKTFGVKASEKTETGETRAITEKDGRENYGQREDSLEISLEGRLAAAEEQEAYSGFIAGEAEDSGISVGLNVNGPGEAGETEAEDSGEAAEQGVDGPDTSEKQGGKVGVNEGKRMRQIAAAKSRGQVQQVLALLQKDLADCKAGLEKGWCDEAEIAKVEALISRAEARMSQVPQENSRENGQGGLDEFAMASLM
ncbi:MAG: hypothetical protein HFH17_08015 [Ruminococcus sp.]|nr:hypothetical protein [Ruminococcus sp.]